MYRHLLTPLALAGLLTACMSTNIDPRQSKLAQLQPGATSYDQVIGALGAPKREMVYADQSRLVIYDYAQLSTAGRPRVPALVLLTRDADASIISALLAFGSTGTLRYWSVDGCGK